MDLRQNLASRRQFIQRAGIAAASLSLPAWWDVQGAFADLLALTPSQTEGPFYPTKLPLDTDNDLLVINDGITPAVGEITHLTGRILDASGAPLRNTLVEIWQVDNHGVYLHPGSDNGNNRDKNFQGFGKFLTSSTGEYYFRTVKPVPYPGRTPHIHFKVKRKGQPEFVTQCYIKGHPQNERDGVLRGMRDAKTRELVMVDFAPIKESKIGELGAKFDIVLGVTPADA